MNKKAQNPGNILATVIVLIITVYVAYQMIVAFSQADPSFGKYGWPILGALVVGIIAWLRAGGPFNQ